MAGDWIQMRCDLADDPAVIHIAAGTGLDVDHVVGKLHRLWSWADRQASAGSARLPPRWVDGHLHCEGFAALMVEVGWLDFDIVSGLLMFPHFDRYHSKPAKARALANKRQKRHRDDSVTQVSRSTVTSALPKKRREEKKREEKRTEEKIKKNTRMTRPSLALLTEYCEGRQNGIDPQYFLDYQEARGWILSNGKPMRDWRATIRTWEKNKINRPADDPRGTKAAMTQYLETERKQDGS